MDIELSIYTAGSSTSVNHLSGQVKASESISPVASGMLLFTYKTGSRHGITTGINLYKTNWGFRYLLEKQQYHLPFDISIPEYNPVWAVNLPLFYTCTIPVSEKIRCSAELGAFITYPLQVETSNSSSGYTSSEQQHIYLNVEYTPVSVTGGIYTGFSVIYALKRNALKLGIFANIPLQKQRIGSYVFFPENPEFFSTGNIESGSGLLGIKLGFVFTGAKK